MSQAKAQPPLGLHEDTEPFVVRLVPRIASLVVGQRDGAIGKLLENTLIDMYHSACKTDIKPGEYACIDYFRFVIIFVAGGQEAKNKSKRLTM
jgi:hypothetical protein